MSRSKYKAYTYGQVSDYKEYVNRCEEVVHHYERVLVKTSIIPNIANGYIAVHGSKVHTFYTINKRAYTSGVYNIAHLKKRIHRG
jgi:hypothetical protein